MTNEMPNTAATYTVVDLRDHSRGRNGATPGLAKAMAGRLVRKPDSVMTVVETVHGVAYGHFQPLLRQTVEIEDPREQWTLGLDRGAENA